LSGKIGAYIAPNILLQQYKYGFFSSLLYGAEEVYHQIGFSFRTFGAIIRTSFSDTASREQKQEATAGIGGPVAIGRVFVGLADYGVELRSVIVLTAMISLSLGVFNLLPFPALDGGRCLLVIVNQAIHVINPKFKISPRIEQMIHSLGFIILILASILVTWKDIFFHQ
jgi:regulator of sigma E protease